MTITTENPTTDRERGLPCDVRHPDAGGQCERTATVRAFGLHYCGIHGEELAAAAGPAEDHLQALVRAYPDAPEGVRANVLQWERDEGPNRGAVVASLLSSLGTLRKLMRVAHEDGETWLVEVLERERESVAAQAAYALRERAGDRPTE
jgi:hypothetical protein